jgi:calcium-dependent protein kinase
MEHVKSVNIVAFYEVMESNQNYYIVQELCDGNLSSMMKHNCKIPEEKAKGYLLQMTNGFLALVQEGIIHRYCSLTQRPQACQHIQKWEHLENRGFWVFD